MIVEIGWSELKAFKNAAYKQFIYIAEGNGNYLIFCPATSGLVFKCFLRAGSADLTDFDTNYKSSANKEEINTISTFTSKALSNGKKLYARNTGIQASLSSGSNTITYTATLAWAKFVGAEVVNSEALDTVDFKVYDDANGTYSGVPNRLLNQFGFTVNLPKDYYVRIANYDADIYVGMVIEVTYTSISTKTIGINFIMNEVKQGFKMANEALKLVHLSGGAVQADDPVSSADPAVKLLAQAILALAAKLDADSADTGGDADYEATLNALSL